MFIEVTTYKGGKFTLNIQSITMFEGVPECDKEGWKQNGNEHLCSTNSYMYVAGIDLHKEPLYLKTTYEEIWTLIKMATR